VAEGPVDQMNRSGRAAPRIPPSAVRVGVLSAEWRVEVAPRRKFVPTARRYAAAQLMADVGLGVEVSSSSMRRSRQRMSATSSGSRVSHLNSY